MNRLICHANVQRGAIGIRVDSDWRDAHLAARARDSHSDLSAIGDQEFLKHRRNEV
jgi:hypothetical protein